MKVKKIHTPIVLITGIIHNHKREILLIKRSKNNRTFHGFWQLPEGVIEFGEQPIETLKREIKEEINCKLISSKFLATCSTIVSFDDNSYHLLRIAFKIKCKGEIRLSEEHDDFEWISIKKALKLKKLVSGIKEILLKL